MNCDTVLILTLLFSSQQVLSDDDDFFDDSFHDDFNELEEENQFSEKIEDGWRNWEERCLEIGGEEVLKKWQREQEQLIYCFTDQFDQDTILAEIEVKKKSGDLDEVFKKYCGSPVSKLRSCLEKFLYISHQCLHEEDRVGLNITLKMVDAAINFTCHNSGDRIALFMAESGMDCVDENKDHILSCLNSSVPEIFQNDGRSGARMHFYVFQQENCRKGDAIIHCVETSLMECKDPTPSNLIHGLLRSMKAQTPCARAAQLWHSGALPTLISTLLLLLSLQTSFYTL